MAGAPAPSSPGASSRRWHAAGSALLAAFDHVYVLTLRGAELRRQHMAALLEGQLGMPAERVSYLMGASSREWGQWHGIAFLEQAREKMPHTDQWWMQTQICNPTMHLGGRFAPPCLRERFAGCLSNQSIPHDSVSLPRMCGELCYTISISAAMHVFLQSPHERALILEDDLCATNALFCSWDELRWLRKHRSEWDLIKMGDCFRGVKGIIPRDHLPDAYERAVTGSCEKDGSGHPNTTCTNAILPSLPRVGNCAHALGVNRRMAQHIIEQAFPAADVFDNLLTQHLRNQNGTGMRIHHFNLSIFAQVHKSGIKTKDLPKEMRSANHGKSLKVNMLNQ